MRLPERTKLICLPPCYPNSPYVERLTSYIKRHAAKLCVQTGTFIKHVIGSEIKDPYLVADLTRGATRFIERSPTINGFHQLAGSMVNMFQGLTKWIQLDQLTLLSWKGRISTLDVLKNKLCWCPQCFYQWSENKEILYEPLYWMVNGITICAIHHCYLQEQCQNCDRELRVLMNNSKIEFCSFCNESLCKDNKVDETPQHFEVEASLFIINMLFTGNFNIDRNSFIKKWVDNYWNGCCLKAANSLGIPFATLFDWYKNFHFHVFTNFSRCISKSSNHQIPNMMLIYECVRRYSRMQKTIVVDGGKEFHSIYFDTLIAFYGRNKKIRPAGKPRFGSVIERNFGTTNTAFINNLIGNTQSTKNVRTVTKETNPKNHAIWTLPALFKRLCEFSYEIYDKCEHSILLQSPRDFYALGLERTGERLATIIHFDQIFHFMTLPTTTKSNAKNEPGKGFKCNYLFYSAEAIRTNANLNMYRNA